MKKYFFLIIIIVVYCSCSTKPEADFSWTPQNPTAGQEIQFQNLSLNANKSSWNLGDMTISKETSPKHIYENPGEYIIDLNVTHGLKSDQKTVTIKVLPKNGFSIKTQIAREGFDFYNQIQYHQQQEKHF